MITGEAIADAILKTLETWDLPVANMRGQCYDGAPIWLVLSLVARQLYNNKLQWLSVFTVLHIG